MFRKPAFWAAFTAVALLGVAVAIQLFPRAMPFVTLDLQMDRAGAMARAQELAATHGWGPPDHRVAAGLMSSDTVQSYIELEGGGNEAFARMLGEDVYRPFTWDVRLFQEHEANETLVRFTPEGDPYGFRETLPEDAPGAALDEKQARAIAEAAAVEAWGIDLREFAPLEASQEVRPGGRVDHTLVYERVGAEHRRGEERYRLRLVVSGDRLTELIHFVKVPEAFERRFAEMRSRNELVSDLSNGTVFVLYGAGAIVGLFLLLRIRWVVWRPALPWAGAVALGISAALLSQWPLDWMGYDTAVSANAFAAQLVIYAILNGLFMGIVALVGMVAGESLGRRAFPHHPQLWKLWTPEAARSREALGGTVGAYLLVGALLAYLTALYAFAREQLGWWMPSAPLTDPNVVSSYLPWLFPIAISLQAGFVEEVVFRAIPLAGAVLLGRRFGGQRYWVAGALLLQAILFGAVHANYPAQPAYARLVEIAIPFVFVGAIYLAFGLLPAIVMHFAFDVVMFSLPLFASSAPGVWIDRTLVVILGLLPVWVVLLARLRGGRWQGLPEALRNGAWAPPPREEKVAPPRAPAARPALAPRTVVGLLTAGALGLVLWGALTPFRADAPPVELTRSEALAAARATLDERGVTLDDSWRELPSVAGDVGLADRFVWQSGGPEVYRAVVGSHIEAPHWQVRYARFEGDVVERAEEHVVHVDNTATAFRVQHALPEGRAGAALSREEARERVSSAIGSTLGIEPSELREVSAEPAERPSRRDWSFVLEDPGVSLGETGEARLAVTLAGDEVTDVFRHVHVPEEWQRAELERASLGAIVTNVCGFPVGLGLLAGAVAGLVGWSRGRFARGTFALVFGGLLLVLVLRVLNAWPLLAASFDTTQPWGQQALIGVGGGLVAAGFFAALLALIAGFVHRWLPPADPAPVAARLLRGAALGTAWAGVSAVATAFTPAVDPLWAALSSAGTTLPWIGPALEAIRGWAIQTLVLLLLVGLAGRVTRGGTSRLGAGAALLVLSGLVLSGAGGVETLGLWLISGLGTGVVLWLSWLLVLRVQPSVLPAATAAMGVLVLFRESALAAWPGASTGAALAVALLGALAVWWVGRIDADAA
jgi:membrane protease YdiL (CAAX protease family)